MPKKLSISDRYNFLFSICGSHPKAQDIKTKIMSNLIPVIVPIINVILIYYLNFRIFDHFYF